MDPRALRQFALAARALPQQARNELARNKIIHVLASRVTPYQNDPKAEWNREEELARLAQSGMGAMPHGLAAGMGPEANAALEAFANAAAAPGAFTPPGAVMQTPLPPFMQNPPGGPGPLPAAFSPAAAAPGAAQSASADTAPAPDSAGPFRSPGGADNRGSQAAQADASDDKPQKSGKELARERVCPFVLPRPWGKNRQAFNAMYIVDRYKPGKRAGDPFRTPEEAVRAALGRFQNDRNEYLAIILRFTEGPYKNQYTWSCLQRGYKYSPQEARKLRRADKGVDVPGNVRHVARVDGTRVYAWAHTHGIVSGAPGLGRFNVSGESDCDKTVTKVTGIKGYLLRRGRVEEIEPGYQKHCVRKEKPGQSGRSGRTAAAFARPGEHCARRSGRGGEAPPG